MVGCGQGTKEWERIGDIRFNRVVRFEGAKSPEGQADTETTEANTKT